MAVLEKSALMVTQDSAGNDVLIYPITTIENVDGGLTEEEIATKIKSTNIPYENIDNIPETYTKSQVDEIMAKVIVNITIENNTLTYEKGDGSKVSFNFSDITWE